LRQVNHSATTAPTATRTWTSAVRNPVISVAAGPVSFGSVSRSPSSHQGPCQINSKSPPATVSTAAAISFRPARLARPANHLSTRPAWARHRLRTLHHSASRMLVVVF
jgi:hypothetical protein